MEDKRQMMTETLDVNRVVIVTLLPLADTKALKHLNRCNENYSLDYALVACFQFAFIVSC